MSETRSPLTDEGPTSTAFFHSVRRALGLDRAVTFTLLARLWQVLAGPLTLLVIVRSLTPAQQGLYYTFGNLVALQVFFELGLSYVVLQFASHEKAALDWTPSGTLDGPPEAKGRLCSLAQLALRWYGAIALAIAVVLLPVGLIFFGQSHDIANTDWKTAWALLVTVSAGNAFLSPFFSLLEGCGLVSQVAGLRVIQGMLSSLALWIGMLLGWGVAALPVAQCIGLALTTWWLVTRHGPFFTDLLLGDSQAFPIGWAEEVWPFQWKIAVSWLSGYFIFQLFNPLVFHFCGAAEAGKMGMSLSLCSTITTLAMSWLNTKVPILGALIAKRDFEGLDHLFFPQLLRAVAVAGIALFTLWLGVWAADRQGLGMAQRLLPPLPLALLAITAALNTIISSMAVYLRAHKQEPFMVISLVSGLLIACFSLFTVQAFGPTGVTATYLAVTSVVSLGGGLRIFLEKRRIWHNEAV